VSYTNKVVLRRQVSQFLLDFKNCLDVTNQFIKTRTVNDETIRKLGYTISQIKDVLYSLTPDDYCHGPKKDQLHGGFYWEFGKEVEGLMVYIKIKIQTSPDGSDSAVCYSFHESDRPMTKFPLIGVP
jgi:hypothetical protein